jgi:hypothetical protein
VGGPTESGAWYRCPLYAGRAGWTDETFRAHLPCPEFGDAGSSHPGGHPFRGEDSCETHSGMLVGCIRGKDAEIARLKAALAEARVIH